MVIEGEVGADGKNEEEKGVRECCKRNDRLEKQS